MRNDFVQIQGVHPPLYFHSGGVMTCQLPHPAYAPDLNPD